MKKIFVMGCLDKSNKKEFLPGLTYASANGEVNVGVVDRCEALKKENEELKQENKRLLDEVERLRAYANKVASGDH